MAALTLHAQPYDTSGIGFYFKSAEDYDKKEAKNRNEEFEIEFIDGDDIEFAVYNAMGVNQSNLHEFFDAVDSVDEYDLPALQYLTTIHGMDFAEALEKVEDVSVFEGTAKDYAYQLIDDIGAEGVRGDYFNYEAFGRDVDLEGTMRPDPDEFDEGEDDPDFIEADENYDRMTKRELGEYVVHDVYGGVEELDQQTLSNYFDYDSFARDLVLGGDVAEASFNGQDYVITNPNEAF